MVVFARLIMLNMAEQVSLKVRRVSWSAPPEKEELSLDYSIFSLV